MSKNYEINIRKLAVMLIPPFLRKPIILALVDSLVRPITQIKTAFDRERESILFDISINSSVCRIEYMLNYVFYKFGLKEKYDRRIYVKNTKYIRGAYLFTGGRYPEGSTDEERPVYGYKGSIKIYTRTEMGSGSIKPNFIVWIPQEANIKADQIPRLKATLNDFILPDKNYEIEYYD